MGDSSWALWRLHYGKIIRGTIMKPSNYLVHPDDSILKKFEAEHPGDKERPSFECYTSLSTPKFVDLDIQDNERAVQDKELPWEKRLEPINIRNTRDIKIAQEEAK